jgi:hypothetical protein
MFVGTQDLCVQSNPTVPSSETIRMGIILLDPFLLDWTQRSCVPTNNTFQKINSLNSLFTPLYTLLTPHYTLLTPHYTLLTPHYTLLTPLYTLLTPLYTLLTPLYTLLTTL